jgi:hypothetical protein
MRRPLARRRPVLADGGIDDKEGRDQSTNDTNMHPVACLVAKRATVPRVWRSLMWWRRHIPR